MKKTNFFSGHKQKKISIREFDAKSPLFYRDLHMMGAVYTADLKVIKQMLPNKHYHPIKFFRNRALVAIHCLEYKDTDIGPYNEVSLSILIQYGLKLVPGFFRIALSGFTHNYHTFIQELPVNTQVAEYGGIDFFNYPKYISDISFRETATHRICTVRDKSTNDLIIEIDGEKIKTKEYPTVKKPEKTNTITLNTYPVIEDKVHQAQVHINQKQSGMSFVINNTNVRLGEHSKSQSFEKLNLGKELQYIYAPKCEAILSMPKEII